MGRMIKVAALVAAFFFAGPSVANKETAKQLCEVFADVAYQIAVERDAGVSIYTLRNRVHQRFDNQDLRQIALDVVEIVFTDPWKAPAHEANSFKMECFRQLGILKAM
jgi:hypothetical protein